VRYTRGPGAKGMPSGKSKRLVVLGGGEHARVTIEAALSRPDEWSLLGFADPLQCEETVSRLGIPRLGADEKDLEALAGDGATYFILGVGDQPARQDLAGRFSRRGARWASVVHARAWVSPTARLDQGVLVCSGAVVQTGASLGQHAIANSGSIIEHDVCVGAFGHVAPGAILGGGAVVGELCYIGLGSRVRDHIRVGDGVTVGMGAVVVNDVPDGETVIGVPARPKVTKGFRQAASG